MKRFNWFVAILAVIVLFAVAWVLQPALAPFAVLPLLGMTALSANRETARKEGDVKSFPVYIATAIYKGSLVMLNSTGYLIPGADTSGCKFAGVAMESVTAAEAVASGTKWCKVYRKGVFYFAAQADLTQAKVGDLMYVYDDQTIAIVGTTTNDVVCGKLVEYGSASLGWVDIGDRVA